MEIQTAKYFFKFFLNNQKLNLFGNVLRKSSETLCQKNTLRLIKAGVLNKTKYDAAVACLFWEQEVMCSNHIISKAYNKF